VVSSSAVPIFWSHLHHEISAKLYCTQVRYLSNNNSHTSVAYKPQTACIVTEDALILRLNAQTIVYGAAKY